MSFDSKNQILDYKYFKKYLNYKNKYLELKGGMPGKCNKQNEVDIDIDYEEYKQKIIHQIKTIINEKEFNELASKGNFKKYQEYNQRDFNLKFNEYLLFEELIETNKSIPYDKNISDINKIITDLNEKNSFIWANSLKKKIIDDYIKMIKYIEEFNLFKLIINFVFQQCPYDAKINEINNTIEEIFKNITIKLNKFFGCTECKNYIINQKKIETLSEYIKDFFDPDEYDVGNDSEYYNIIAANISRRKQTYDEKNEMLKQIKGTHHLDSSDKKILELESDICKLESFLDFNLIKFKDIYLWINVSSMNIEMKNIKIELDEGSFKEYFGYLHSIKYKLDDKSILSHNTKISELLDKIWSFFKINNLVTNESHNYTIISKGYIFDKNETIVDLFGLYFNYDIDGFNIDIYENNSSPFTPSITEEYLYTIPSDNEFFDKILEKDIKILEDTIKEHKDKFGEDIEYERLNNRLIELNKEYIGNNFTINIKDLNLIAEDYSLITTVDFKPKPPIYLGKITTRDLLQKILDNLKLYQKFNPSLSLNIDDYRLGFSITYDEKISPLRNNIKDGNALFLRKK